MLTTTIIIFTSLNDVGRLELPWPTDERPGLPTIEELADDPSHPALHVRHPDYGGWTHAERIAHYLRRLEVEIVAPARRRGEALELEDCCHRICALYQARPANWKLVLCVW